MDVCAVQYLRGGCGPDSFRRLITVDGGHMPLHRSQTHEVATQESSTTNRIQKRGLWSGLHRRSISAEADTRHETCPVKDECQISTSATWKTCTKAWRMVERTKSKTHNRGINTLVPLRKEKGRHHGFPRGLSHRSSGQSRRHLTLQNGRDVARSTWYGHSWWRIGQNFLLAVTRTNGDVSTHHVLVLIN